MNIPILQLPQPWAWATVAGLRTTHGVDANRDLVHGPAAVVSSTTNAGTGQAIDFLREQGVDVPMKKFLWQGAFVGLVEITTAIRRQDVKEYLFLDEHPWQLVLVRPFQLPVPDHRQFFKVKVGFPISEALRSLAGCRDACARGYVEQLRDLEDQ